MTTGERWKMALFCVAIAASFLLVCGAALMGGPR